MLRGQNVTMCSLKQSWKYVEKKFPSDLTFLKYKRDTNALKLWTFSVNSERTKS